MKTLVIFLLCFMLTGCPGDRMKFHTRATYIDGERLCFSVNKRDVLTRYTINSNESGDQTLVATSGNEIFQRSYPDTCINVNWKYGYVYVINYTLNGNNYYHEFFIDNNGQLTHMGEL